MSRPKLDPKMKHKPRKVGFTDDEWALLTLRAKLHNMTPGDYIRHFILRRAKFEQYISNNQDARKAIWGASTIIHSFMTCDFNNSNNNDII